jgi:hypothetical protein
MLPTNRPPTHPGEMLLKEYLEYDAPQFQPVVLEDADGAPHTFLIRSILVPPGLIAMYDELLPKIDGALTQ